MSVSDVVVTLLAVATGVVVTLAVVRLRRARTEPPPRTEERILFPFVGAQLSERALEAALRLARAEHATIVPAYLATIPLALNVDAPLPRTCDVAFSVFEAIEQRAAPAGIRVDARIARGRDARHALRQLIAEVPARRIVVAAATPGRGDGFSADEIAWLMRNAPREVVAVRPDPGEHAPAARRVSPAAPHGSIRLHSSRPVAMRSAG